MTNGYSVQAEQSSQSLYSYVMNTYDKSYKDNSKAKDELIRLKEEYKVLEHSNLQAESFNILKDYSSTLEEELNIKIDDEVNELQLQQNEVVNEIQSNLTSISPKDLSILNRKYNKLKEDIDFKLDDKTSITSLFGKSPYDEIDTSDIEISIKEQEALISYDTNNTNTDLGNLNEFKVPFNYNKIVSSKMGYRTHPISGLIKFHNGTDYAIPTGTELYSMFNGTVTASGVNGGYGQDIKIDCGNGIIIHYAHLSKRIVNVGDKVVQNQLIGLSGNTGSSTGPHLHLSLYYKGDALDVERLFR